MSYMENAIKYATNGGVNDIASASWSAYSFLIVEQYDAAAGFCLATYTKIDAPVGTMPPATFQDAGGQWWQLSENRINPLMLGATGNLSLDDSAPINLCYAFLTYLAQNPQGAILSEVDGGTQKFRTKRPVYVTDCAVPGRIIYGNMNILASNNDGLNPIAVDFAGSQLTVIKDGFTVTGITAEPGVSASITYPTSAAVTATITTVAATAAAAGTTLTLASVPAIALPGALAFNSTTNTLLPGYMASKSGAVATWSTSLTGLVSNGDNVTFLTNVLTFTTANLPSWVVPGMVGSDVYVPPALDNLKVNSVIAGSGVWYVGFTGLLGFNVGSGDLINWQVQPPNVGIRYCRTQARKWAGAGAHNLRLLQYNGSFKEAGLLDYGSEDNRYPNQQCSNAWGPMQINDGISLKLTASTTLGGNVLSVASVPAWMQKGLALQSQLLPGAIATGVTVASFTGTTITLTGSVANTLVAGDTIWFSQASLFGKPWVQTNAAFAAGSTSLTCAGEIPSFVAQGISLKSSSNPSALNGLFVQSVVRTVVSGVTQYTTINLTGATSAAVTSGDYITFPLPPMCSGTNRILGSSDYVAKYSPSLTALSDYQNPGALYAGTGTSTTTFTAYPSYDVFGNGVGVSYQSTLKMWYWDRIPLATVSASAAGTNTLNFAPNAIPSWIVNGMSLLDTGSPYAPNPLSGLTVTGVNVATGVVTMSGNIPALTGVAAGAIIGFNAGICTGYTSGINYNLSCIDHGFTEMDLRCPSPIGNPTVIALNPSNNYVTLYGTNNALITGPQALRDGTPVFIDDWKGGALVNASGYSYTSGGVTVIPVASTTGISVGMLVQNNSKCSIQNGGVFNPFSGLTVASIGAGTVTLSGLATGAPVSPSDALAFGVTIANNTIYYIKTVMSPLPTATTYNIQLFYDPALTLIVPLSGLVGTSSGAAFASGHMWGMTGTTLTVAGASASSANAFGYCCTYGSPCVVFDSSLATLGSASDGWRFKFQHEALPISSVMYILPASGTIAHNSHAFEIENINQNWSLATIDVQTLGSQSLFINSLVLDITAISASPSVGYFNNPQLINPVGWKLRLPNRKYLHDQSAFRLTGGMDVSFVDGYGRFEQTEQVRLWTPNLQMAGMTVASQTVTGGTVITMTAAIPSWVTVGMPLLDNQAVGALAGITVASKSGSTVTMSSGVLAPVNPGDQVTSADPTASCIMATADSGWFVRYRGFVHVHFRLQLTQKGTIAGNPTIFNLPLAANSLVFFGSGSVGLFSGVTIGVSVSGVQQTFGTPNLRFNRIGDLSQTTGGTSNLIMKDTDVSNTFMVEGDVDYLAPPLTGANA